MGPGQKILIRVGSGIYFGTRVGSGQPPTGLENFPQNPPNFSIFLPLGQKISLD